MVVAGRGGVMGSIRWDGRLLRETRSEGRKEKWTEKWMGKLKQRVKKKKGSMLPL